MSAMASDEATRDEQRIYQAQLAHLDDCAPCSAENPCDDGRKISRALQAARLAATPPRNSRRGPGG